MASFIKKIVTGIIGEKGKPSTPGTPFQKFLGIGRGSEKVATPVSAGPAEAKSGGEEGEQIGVKGKKREKYHSIKTRPLGISEKAEVMRKRLLGE